MTQPATELLGKLLNTVETGIALIIAGKDADIAELKKQLIEADDFLDELECIWGEQSRYLRRDHSLEGLRTFRQQLAEATNTEGK